MLPHDDFFVHAWLSKPEVWSGFVVTGVITWSESWLHGDNNVSVEGFQMVQADRDCTESSKRKGGRLAVFVDNRWCNPGHVTIKDGIFEFSHTIGVVVYISPIDRLISQTIF